MTLPHIFETITEKAAHRLAYHFENGWVSLAPLAADQLGIEVGDEVLIKFRELDGATLAVMHVYRDNTHRKTAHFDRTALAISHPDAAKEFLPVG
jgi:hypothetical protein